MDKSLVHNLNALLQNKKSHDTDIRSLYQIIKSLGHHFDQGHPLQHAYKHWALYYERDAVFR